MLFVILKIWLSLIVSCASIKAPDVPVFVELDVDHGFGTYTISDKDINVSETELFTMADGRKLTWWEMRPYMLLLPVESYAEFKKFTIKICKKYKECSEITNWERTFDKIDDKLKAIGATP